MISAQGTLSGLQDRRHSQGASHQRNALLGCKLRSSSHSARPQNERLAEA